MVVVSTYDLGAGALDAVRSAWESWRSANYPESEPAS